MSKINWLFLMLAIIFENIATNSLKATNAFKNVVPSIITVVGYINVLFFLSLALRTIPVGIAYATWSGVGIILLTSVSWIYHKQILDLPAIVGIGFIVAGIVIMNAFSKSMSH